jgi:hypothetical protein
MAERLGIWVSLSTVAALCFSESSLASVLMAAVSWRSTPPRGTCRRME